MSVTLDLKPETVRKVAAKAAARGVSVEAYLTDLIEGGALLPDAETVSPDQFEADMDLVAVDSERLPVLAPEAYSRESIYADHD
jgi:hypothetical protein